MKITFYAHASFRFEADGTTLITDPYTPAPGNSGFDRIDEPADLVLMSSATDPFHSDPSHVRGDPVVVNTLELPPEGTVACGVPIRSFPAYESKSFDFQGEFGRDPDANALYRFEIGGMSVLHMGDIGNPVDPAQLDELAGTVDVLLALTGEHATIALDDLDRAIDRIAPKAIIPMHYYSPKGVLKIEPVDRFLDRQDPARITRVGGPTLTLTPDMLNPISPPIFVFEQSR